MAAKRKSAKKSAKRSKKLNKGKKLESTQTLMGNPGVNTKL